MAIAKHKNGREKCLRGKQKRMQLLCDLYDEPLENLTRVTRHEDDHLHELYIGWQAALLTGLDVDEDEPEELDAHVS